MFVSILSGTRAPGPRRGSLVRVLALLGGGRMGGFVTGEQNRVNFVTLLFQRSFCGVHPCDPRRSLHVPFSSLLGHGVGAAARVTPPPFFRRAAPQTLRAARHLPWLVPVRPRQVCGGIRARQAGRVPGTAGCGPIE